MGQGALANCTKLLALEPDFEYGGHQFGQYQKSGGPPQPAAGPQLALRIAYAPIEESLGAKPSIFGAGDEIAVVELKKVKGWEPLGWRQERSAKQHAAMDNGNKMSWPQGPRFSIAQRFWCAKVVSSDGRGGFDEHWCMLQVAVSPKDRQMENVKAGVEDAKDVASYAHRFNMQTARTCDADPESVPGVRVATPVAAFVIGSAVPDVASPGEAVSVAMYPAPTVKKFVFDGGEDFLELPQAFFHYCAWVSGGREFVGDIQGLQDDSDVILVDPVVLRATKPSIGDLLGVLVPSTDQPGDNSQDSMRFDVWHPRCGQLCQGFDPSRRSVNGRRHCGLSLPNCGVGGG